MSVAFKPELPFPPAEAFGRPGAEPTWTRASKQGAGTAMSPLSKVWFTLEGGNITEVFYPDVATACVKDLKFLVTDGKTFFDEEGRDTEVADFSYINEKAPAYSITNRARSGLYSITKRIITDTRANSLVVNCSFKALHGTRGDFKVYVLFAPHIRNSGHLNSGRCASYGGKTYLIAWKDGISAVLTADHPFLKMSAGYSGVSDGWHDLNADKQMDWVFERALDGNVALTAELQPVSELNIVLSFGRDDLEAALEAEKTLSRDYRDLERDYIRGWKQYAAGLYDLGRAAKDGGKRFWASAIALKSHEDKTYPGQVISSLSIPWGEARANGSPDPYHTVWPRDLCRTGLSFLAMGDIETAQSIMQSLQSTQMPAGSWPQSMLIDGRLHRSAIDFENISMPVILAWKLKELGAAGDELYPMVRRAASYIAINGPVAEKEAWEERMGFSPSVLAAEISALVAAAHWAAEMGEDKESEYLFSIADNWQTKLEDWTFVECDCIGEGISGHYLRIEHDAKERIETNDGSIHAVVLNRGKSQSLPHRQGEILDSGFLDLVRFGVRGPRDPRVVHSLRVADRWLSYEHHGKTAFYRLSGDGYGEKEDGSPFNGSGAGRPWPMYAGERAIYETIADGAPERYIQSFESFANEGFMFPEQIWDESSIPERKLFTGKGTGSATPLVQAHAEYINALRTFRDRKAFDTVREVKSRYVDRITRLDMAVWKKTKLVSSAKSRDRIRIAVFEGANLLWTGDNWAAKTEESMKDSGLGIWYFDFEPERFAPGTALKFTFHYPERDKWEGKDYEIKIY